MLIEKKSNYHFLYSEFSQADTFFPEDFEDEHKMIAEMTSKFVMNEVYPKLEKIEKQ